MTKLLLKIVIMVSMLLVFFKLTSTRLVFDGSDLKKNLFETKLNNYNKHHYDTVFIGSSRVYRQISPAFFDSCMNNSTHSFNFGVAGYSPQETINLLKSTILQKDPLPDLVFMELWVTPNINPSKTTFSLKTKSQQIKADLYKFSKLGMGPSIVTMFIDEKIRSTPSQRYLGRNNDGYYPLDLNLKDTELINLQTRRFNFLADAQADTNTRIYSNYSISRGYKIKKDNSDLIVKLNDLISEAAKKSVKLVFIIMPLMTHQYEEIIPLTLELPSQNVINLADPSEFPEFYEAKFMFDNGHLNAAGARLFTEKLSIKYKDLLQTSH